MVTLLPGRGAIREDPNNDAARQSGVAASLSEKRQLVSDIRQCGIGITGLTGLIIGSETAATIAPATFANLLLVSAKAAEQGCGGLVCMAISSDPTADRRCHDAMDYVDPIRQAGFLLGAVATGSGMRAAESGLVFAAAGSLYESVECLASVDILGAADKAYSFREHVIDLLNEFNQAHLLEVQPAIPIDYDPPTLPGRGDVDGSDKEKIAMGGAGRSFNDGPPDEDDG